MAENTGLKNLVNGKPLDDTDVSAVPSHIREIIDFLANSSFGIPATAPVASITMYAAELAPTGWLLCNGSAVSRDTYTDLFDMIGTRFGVGDGSTTFNLPDLRRRFPLGAGGTKLFEANTSSGQDEDWEINPTLGSTGGEEIHTTLRDELPAEGIEGVTPVSSGTSNPFGDGETTVRKAAGSQTDGDIGLTEDLGAGINSNNMPPALVLNFIIKAY